MRKICLIIMLIIMMQSLVAYSATNPTTISSSFDSDYRAKATESSILTIEKRIKIADIYMRLEGNSTFTVEPYYDNTDNTYCAIKMNTDPSFDRNIAIFTEEDAKSFHLSSMYDKCSWVFDGTSVKILAGLFDSKGKLVFAYDGNVVVDNR